METLRTGVSTYHDGYAGHTIKGTTVLHICTLVDTSKKFRPLEQGSLKTMTIVKDGPSWVRMFIIHVRQRTIRRSMETLRREVSNRHDGCEGRTIEATKVHSICLLVDTKKKIETLRTRVCDNNDDFVGQTVVDVRQRTLRKSWRSLGLGSVTTITVMKVGSSFPRRSVAYVRLCTLTENE